MNRVSFFPARARRRRQTKKKMPTPPDFDPSDFDAIATEVTAYVATLGDDARHLLVVDSPDEIDEDREDALQELAAVASRHSYAENPKCTIQDREAYHDAVCAYVEEFYTEDKSADTLSCEEMCAATAIGAENIGKDNVADWIRGREGEFVPLARRLRSFARARIAETFAKVYRPENAPNVDRRTTTGAALSPFQMFLLDKMNRGLV